jgi:hypothetical protein
MKAEGWHRQYLQSPINFPQFVGAQKFIALGEVMAAKKASAGAQGRRMGSLEDTVTTLVDSSTLFLRV